MARIRPHSQAGQGRWQRQLCLLSPPITPLNLPSSGSGFTDLKMWQKPEGQQWTGHFTMASQGPACIAGCWGRGSGEVHPYPWDSPGSLRAASTRPSAWRGTEVPTLCGALLRFVVLLPLPTSLIPLWSQAQCPSISHSTPLPFLLQNLWFSGTRPEIPVPFCRPPKATWGKWCLPSDLLVVRPSGHHLQRAQVSSST